MQANYEPFIDRMIQKYEGGYGWDAGDSGGPTKYGITCYDLAEHDGKKMNSMSSWAPLVKAMPLATAEEIYKTKYATACKFDQLNSGKDAVLLDYGVNSGPSRAIKVAQALVSQPQTGKFDNGLIDAVNKADPHWFIDSVCDERLRFMHNIRGGEMWDTFGRGWSSRVADLRNYCQDLNDHAPTKDAVDLSKVTTPKANNQNPNVAKNTGGGVGTVIAGGGSVGVLSGIPWPLVIGAVVVVVIAGVVYVTWRKRQADAADAIIHLPGR